jgi:hypothetical protein
MAYFKNGFTGLDMDSSPRANNGSKYKELINGNLTAIGDMDTGAITNSKGNTKIHSFPSAIVLEDPDGTGITQQNDLVVIGSCVIGEYVVYFTVSNSVGVPNTVLPNQGQIWKARYYPNGTYDLELIYNNRLNFSKENLIQAVGSIINEDRYKVYFVDGYNQLRAVNILDPDLGSKSPDALDIVGDVQLSEASAVMRKGGYYQSGSVQYAYQMINYNGVETIFSPTSGIYHISDDSTDGSVGDAYKGTLDQSTTEDNTGNGFNVTISTIDPSYAYVRLVAIYYKSYNGTPEVRVVAEKQIYGDTMTFFDDGKVSMGLFSLTELTTIGLLALSPSAISSASNRLAIANCKRYEFDFDYDARAYRYNSSYVAKVYSGDGTEYYTIDTDGDWTKSTGGSGSNFSISNDFDAINTDQNTYKYKADGATIGGEGKNISYSIKMIDVDIDVITSREGVLNTGTVNWQEKIDPIVSHNLKPTTGYVGYANEAIANQVTGYKRDEVYRFGIVGFDKKSRPSYVKWIADIKMPKINDTTSETLWVDENYEDHIDYTISHIVDGVVKGYQVYLEFKVNNLPQNVYSYSIVREERTLTDRSRINQGFVSHVIRRANNDLAPAPYPRMVRTATDNEVKGADLYSMKSNLGGSVEKKLLTFWGPEASYKNYSLYEGNINILGYGTIYKPQGATAEYFETSGRPRELQYKIGKIQSLNTPFETYPDVIKIVTPKYGYQQIQSIGTYRHYLSSETSTGNRPIGSPMGTAFLAYYPDGGGCLWDGNNIRTEILEMFNDYGADSTFANSILIGEIALNLPAQYGGSTYNNRLNRKYMAASHRAAKSDSVIAVFGGDSRVQMYEFLRNFANVTDGDRNWSFNASYSGDERQTAVSVVRMPVESFINLDARAHQNYGSLPSGNRVVIAEESGYHWIQQSDNTIEIQQATGFYSYNSAYSQPNNAFTYVSKPLYYDEISLDEPNNIYVSNSFQKLGVSDEWLKFLPEQTLNVTGTYGPITSLVGFKERMIFVQKNAIGVFTLDPATIITSSEEELVLGSKKAFTLPSYISETYGTQYRFSTIKTNTGIYLVDEEKKAIVFLNGDGVELSLIKGVASYLKANLDDSFVNGAFIKSNDIISFGFDKKVYFNFRGVMGTLVYNEISGSFETILDNVPRGTVIYSTKPDFYISVGNVMLSIANMVSNDKLEQSIWMENSRTDSMYYNSAFSNKMSFTYVVGQDELSKVFDSIEFNLESSGSKLVSLSVLRNGSAIASITDSNGIGSYRFNKWRVTIPRENTNEFMKPRYTNDYAIIKLVFDIEEQGSLKLLDLITHYRLQSMPFN